uniref:Uncharacterized protein n=1 Tax=Coccolithus braarudii TaxID=221442 RepID=A0A7S0L6K8_9EUKA
MSRQSTLLLVVVLIAPACARPCRFADLSKAGISLVECTSLQLNDAPLTSAHISSVSAALALEAVHMHGVRLGSSGASLLADALGQLPSLRELGVGSCRLGDRGLQTLLRSLPPTLRVLDVQHNLIQDPGVRLLATELSQGSQLSSVNLSWNGISPRGARALADALQNNTALEVLSLNWNGLKDKGAKHLGEALPFNNKLSNLALEHNAIKDTGARHLAKGLKANGAVQVLQLGGNGVSKATEAVVLEALQAAPQMEEPPPPPPLRAYIKEESADTDEEVEEISFDEEEERVGGSRDEL